jgi:hypothetical protein
MGELTQPRPTISVERVTEADLQGARMGSNGNPTYEEQFGTTSAPLGSVGVTQPSIAELEIQAQQALARATNPLAFAQQGEPQVQQPAEPNEVEKWKQLYGQSENEKGLARKREADLMEAFNGLMAQYESLQANVQQPQQAWVPQGPPNPFGQAPYGMPMPQFQDPFEGVNESEFLDGKTARNVIERAVGQMAAFNAGQAQQAMNRVSQLERQLIQQARANAGISKLDEFRIGAKNPWLNGLPEGQRLAAIQSLKAAETAAQPTNGNGNLQGQPNPGPAESQNRILNRVTYIEGNTPNVQDQTEAALEAARQRDYAIAMNAPAETGERARMLRAFANKHGLNIGQNPSDLAR